MGGSEGATLGWTSDNAASMLPDDMEKGTTSMNRVSPAAATAVAVILLAVVGCSKNNPRRRHSHRRQ